MSTTLAHVALLVRDYDEAIAFFSDKMRFVLVEDSPRSPGKRWVVMAPRGGGASILLARAATDEQRACIGKHAGGRVGWFLHTDDFDEEYAYMKARGVVFTEEPRAEEYGKVVVFLDLYGNKWDLIERP